MKKILAALLLVSTLLITGCEEIAKDDPRFRVEADKAQVAQSEGFFMPGATEVDLVEKMAAARSGYYASLQDLIDYYRCNGDMVKLNWATKELQTLGVVPQYKFLMAAEVASPNLRASDSIKAADLLFADAQQLNSKARAMVVAVDDNLLRAALSKYNEVIQKYPTSDKIDDAAYRAAEIYQHFQDYEIAATYYQRAFQWNNETKFPARFKAAYILDQKLNKTKEALTLYRLAYQCEARYPANRDYAKSRILQLTYTCEKVKAKAEISGN